MLLSNTRFIVIFCHLLIAMEAPGIYGFAITGKVEQHYNQRHNNNKNKKNKSFICDEYLY